jgi:methylglyoxal/glyoxal reductase
MEQLSISSTIPLNDGNRIPVLGFGVFKAEDGAECETAVRTALQVGYRHIDTASDYKNEASVGRAIKECGISRKEIFVTTKLWPPFEVANVRDEFERSLNRLQMDYVDLYLIHWPIRCYREAWEILVELKKKGKCKSIGVSNFTVKRFRKGFPTKFMPAVNQVEMHVYNQRRQLVRFCERKGIVMEAYSPLAKSMKLNNQVVGLIAQAKSKSPAQVMIRFLLQKGEVALPKSVTADRIRENSEVFDFALDADQMRKLEALNDESYYSNLMVPRGFY